MAKKIKLALVQGKTFTKVFRWAVEPFLYIPITSVALVAPVLITAPGHGLPDGWFVAPVSIKGTTELNAAGGGSDFDNDYKRITVEDADTVSINSINAAGYSAYLSGGYLQTPTPVDLAGYEARLTIKDKDGTELAQLTSVDGDIVIDNTNKKISMTITAAETAAYVVASFKKAVYELEMYTVGGVVYRIAYGDVTLEKEIAT